jgi:hypothetical protein
MEVLIILTIATTLIFLAAAVHSVYTAMIPDKIKKRRKQRIEREN